MRGIDKKISSLEYFTRRRLLKKIRLVLFPVMRGFEVRSSSSIKLQHLIAYYEVRDTLVGDNCKVQDVKKAFELAAVCEHSEAVWLTNLFNGRVCTTAQEAEQVFLESNDPRADCFAAMLGHPLNLSLLRGSAQLGCAFAQSALAYETTFNESFRWAQESALQGERNGFFMLGRCYSCPEWCEKDLKRARESYLAAAELDHANSMRAYGLLLERTDPLRFVWMGMAAVRGAHLYFLLNFVDHINEFNSGGQGANVVFAIGRALKGHVSANKREIFGHGVDSDSLIDTANQAILFYDFQLSACRRAVDAWSICARQLGVVKDVRLMIGMLIWDGRADAKHSAGCEADACQIE